MKFGKRVEGLQGRGEQLLVEEKDVLNVDHNATIDLWFLTIPGQSMFWDKYLLGIYHLRPIEGGTPVKKKFEHVTHELALIALNPDKNPNPLDMQSWQHLTPLNFVIQIELPSDEKAQELLGLAARAVVDGVLWAEPPLSGQQEPWQTSILRTAAHMRGEEHAQH